MYEVTAEMIDEISCMVRVVSSSSMYLEFGDIWDMRELGEFCEREMIDLVIC